MRLYAIREREYFDWIGQNEKQRIRVTLGITENPIHQERIEY